MSKQLQTRASALDTIYCFMLSSTKISQTIGEIKTICLHLHQGLQSSNNIELHAVFHLQYVFLKFVFLAALASWLCWLHRFGLFLADELGKKFGQQFFSGPRYKVNFQLPAVGRTSKKHTITNKKSCFDFKNRIHGSIPYVQYSMYTT